MHSLQERAEFLSFGFSPARPSRREGRAREELRKPLVRRWCRLWMNNPPTAVRRYLRDTV